MKKENLLNQIFGRLTVIEEDLSISGRSAWKCACTCGNVKTVKAENLKGNHTKSCGCLNIEQRSINANKLSKANTKYHPSITTARSIWKKRYNDGITFEEFIELSQKDCHYCGSLPNNIQNAAKYDKKSSASAKENGSFIYNGLDRVDNSLPHILTNVVPCCKWCNYAKRERTTQEFEEWIDKLIIRRQIKENSACEENSN